MVQAALRCGTPVVALSFSCTTPAQVQNKGRREVQNGGGGGGAEGGDGNLEMIAEDENKDFSEGTLMRMSPIPTTSITIQTSTTTTTVTKTRF